MKENVKLVDVSCIVPRMAGKIVSEVTYLDETSVIIPVSPGTIIRWIAWKNYININRVVARSRELNFQKKGVPLPVGVHDAYMPFHLAEEMERGHTCFGYCNVANQIVDVLPVPGMKRRSKLILNNGIELLVDLGPSVISSYLAKSIATHKRILHEMMYGTLQSISL